MPLRLVAPVGAPGAGPPGAGPPGAGPPGAAPMGPLGAPPPGSFGAPQGRDVNEDIEMVNGNLPDTSRPPVDSTNTHVAAPDTPPSVPKWGEEGFVEVVGARHGEDGFAPCSNPHAGSRAKIRHSTSQCRRQPTQPAPRASMPARGRGRQNNSSGSGRQNNAAGSHRQNNSSGSNQQSSFPGLLGQQNSLASLLGQQNGLAGRLGQQNPLLGLGLHNNLPGFGLQGSQVPGSVSQDLRRDGLAALAAIASNISDITQGRDQQQLLELQMQQQQQQMMFQGAALQGAALQQQLDAQPSQQQPSSARSRRGPPQDSSTDAQRNGVKKFQKRGPKKPWQPPRNGNNGPGGNGSAGAGGSAQV
jgi:hypothetical protein